MNPSTSPGHELPPADARPPALRHPLRAALLLAALAFALLFVGHRYGGRIGATLAAMWQDLAGATTTAHAGEPGRYFTCGMHPWVILPEPGLCPICHMDLTPLDAGKVSGQLSIDPVVAQNIGVRTALVESGPLVGTVRTVGKVDYDETRLHDVSLRVDGWIETLHVDFVGERVAAGQPLFELYSPELFAAQQEFVLALPAADAPATTPPATALTAARTRLAFAGIDAAQIEALARSRTARRTLTITSPIAGTVIKKMAVAGMRVDPGMAVYRIVDLDRVWVIVTVYEYQLPFVELGQPAVMTLPYVPGQQFEGRVSYVYPWTDERTRAVNVRLEFDNANGLLKPGMYVNVQLQRTLAAERTLVSRSAVIGTGERQVAFVALNGGRFEPRNVRLGVETEGGKVEVVDGLKPGERVVVSAQFLLDSESKIRESLLRMLHDGVVGAPGPAAANAPVLAELPVALAAAENDLLDGYLAIAARLAGDSADGIATPARAIAAAVDTMLATAVPGHQHFWHEHDEAATIRGKALELVADPQLAPARLAFYDLSIALAKLLRATGVPRAHQSAIEELHCPMFREQQGGAVWLQNAGAVRNPYFGSQMLGCFDSRQALPRARDGDAEVEHR